MAHLESGGEIEGGGGFLNRLDDLRTVMPGIAAPQAGGAIENGPAVMALVMHAVGRDEQARSCLNCRFAVKGIQKESRSLLKLAMTPLPLSYSP